MINIVSGDLFNSKCQLKVNPVNSVGIMGKGLAKTFMEKFPQECKHFNDLSLSYQYNFRIFKLMSPAIYTDINVLMFPTKIHWRDPSKYSYIKDNLEKTLFLLERYNDPSIALPLLGCGLGGLNSDKVIALIDDAFSNYPETVEVYIANV